MWFFKKNKARKEAKKELQRVETLKGVEKAPVKPVQEPIEKVAKREDPKPVKDIKPAPKPVPEPKKEEPKPVVKETTSKKVVSKPVSKTEEPEKKDKAAKYHVSQNKKEGTPHFKEWRVRKEGSNKTIKFFDTQAEAIDYAKELADNQDSSIVIHKVDGTLRKQDYSKK